MKYAHATKLRKIPTLARRASRVLFPLAALLWITAFMAEAGFSEVNQPKITSLKIVSAETISLLAGQSRTFSLAAADATGMSVVPTDARWSLAPDSDSIGYFDGSTFVPTTVGRGRVMVTVDGVSATSAVITVQPGPLSEILLSISADQVVGHRLVGTAKLVLLDQFNNLKTDYNLATEPITLTSETGILTPAVINDTLLFDSGVVDFLPLSVTYAGLSSRVNIVASNGAVTSNTVIVSFNGYDILQAFDFRGQPVTTIYSNLPTEIRAAVANGGNDTAYAQPQLKSYFRSGGGSAKVYFTPHAQGRIDTIPFNLPTDGLTAGADTLVLELQSEYLIGDSVHAATSYLFIPVTVLSPATVDLVPGSLTPDSVYRGVSFGVGFSIQKTNLTAPVDSASMTLALVDSVGATPRAIVYDGPVTASSGNGGSLTYSGIPGLVPEGPSVPFGNYLLRMDYALFSGGNVFTITSRYDGTLTIVPPSAIAYVSGSLSPDSVPAGSQTQFAFDLRLDGARAIKVNTSTTNFRVTGTGFSTSKTMTVADSQLAPGVNHITADSLFIAPNQVGKNLSVTGTFSYHLPGVANELTYTTVFSGETVFIRDVPRIQVVSADAIAYNGYHVNTGQIFTIRCRFTSTADIDSLAVRLVTDGNSQYTSDRVIAHVRASDMTTVDFAITAADAPSPAEVFRFDISSINVLPPIDNLVVMTIERPATLTLSHSLLGTVKNVVANGASFGLSIQMANSGDGAVTPGIFRLSAGGVPLGIADPTIDTIDDRTVINYSLTAPDFDTAVTFQFVFTQRPIDRNTGLPATLNDTAFSVAVYVTALDVRLIVDPVHVGSAMATGGKEKELVVLRLEKGGVSTLSDIAVDRLEMTVEDAEGRPVQARDIFVVGNTAFYEGELRLSSTTAGDSTLKFLFHNLTVSSATTREITLRGLFQESLPHGLRLGMKAEQVHAVFNSGPIAGQPATVVGPGGRDEIFTIPFEVTGGTLASSFVVKDNPFDPDKGAAEFRFLLTDPTGVELKVYTLDGQEVYARDYPGQSAVESGDSFARVAWDGRNNSGDMVRNGVYVVVLTGMKKLEQATVKLAVIR